MLYRVSQLFKAKLQRLIEDINWSNFFCLRHFKKLQTLTFSKKNCILFQFARKPKNYTHQKVVECKNFLLKSVIF